MHKYVVSGKRIKEFMESAGFKQKELHEALGLAGGSNYIGSWEKEEKSITVNNLFLLAEVLGCEVTELVEVRKA